MSAQMWVLVPLLVAPLVLALGFVGCGLNTFGAAPDDPGIPLPPRPPLLYRPVRNPEGVTGPTRLSYEATIMQNLSLLSYWRLADLTGNTAAAARNGGVPAGLAPTDGNYKPSGAQLNRSKPGALTAREPDTACEFSPAIGAYVQIPPQVKLNPVSFSLELWINCYMPLPTVNETAFAAIDRPAIGGPTKGFALFVKTGSTPAITGAIGMGTRSVLTVAAPLLPGWNYVVLVHEPGTARLLLYVNAATPKTTSYDPTKMAFQPNVVREQRIGAAGTDQPTAAPSEVFFGQIDEVALYDVALQMTDIAAHYAASK